MERGSGNGHGFDDLAEGDAHMETSRGIWAPWAAVRKKTRAAPRLAAAAFNAVTRAAAAQVGADLAAAARRAALRRAAVRAGAAHAAAAFGVASIHVVKGLRDAAAHVATFPTVAGRNAAAQYRVWRAAKRENARLKVAARAAARQEANVRDEAMRQAAVRDAALRSAAERKAAARRTVGRLIARDRARKVRRRRVLTGATVVLLMSVSGLAVAGYVVDKIPTPGELELPESTTVYFDDGTTVMARLGTEHRAILAFDEMNDSVKQAIVAAEDRAFWTHSGVDLAGVMRAVWNNVNGGPTQGASTITQQYTRIAADLKGVTYARKAREAIMAWKIDRQYSKDEILAFYLNTVPFGRGAYGIEAAAQAFFGKTARRTAPSAQQVTVAEALILASLVKQPEPDPDDPEGHPGYDPARGGTAAANSISRWEYVREGMVLLGYLTSAEAEKLAYPHTVRDLDAVAPQDGMDRPTGLAVHHVLSELRQSDPFKDRARDYVRNGGFRIVTTLDKRAQEVAEAAADIRRSTAPAAVLGQPANWQAALVAVEPGTGRVLAYYGGNTGTGADHAGWFYDEEGEARGFGQHPPGSSFKVYDLAEALRQKISIWSRWDSPDTKEFPASGRTRDSRAGPVRNASTAPCQPDCTLWEATVASLNVTFFELTERLGTANVIEMANRAGINSIWSDLGGRPEPVRVDLGGRAGKSLVADASVIGRRDVFHRGRHRAVRRDRARPREWHGDVRRRGQARAGAFCPGGDQGRRKGLRRAAHPVRHWARRGSD